MQQSEFQQIREWYQQFEDAVLFYRMDGTPLWQNHAATLRQDQDGASLPRYAPDGTPETGTFSVRQGSVLYLLRQKQCRIGGTPVILVQICAQPEEELFWSDPDRCHEEENRIAAIRQKVFGISNAVSALYQDLDESSDQIPRMILEEQLEQLNIIQGNCCRLMRSSVLRLEQLKYYQNCEVSGEALFLDRELSNFVESCRMVLGRAIRMTLKTAPHLCIFVHRRRLRVSLLCSDFTAAADYAVCVPFHLAGQSSRKTRQCCAVRQSPTAQSRSLTATASRSSCIRRGCARGGTGRTALLPEVSRRPAHLPDRHPGTVYPALSPAPGHPESVPGKQPPGDRRRHLFAVSDLPFRHFGLPVLLNSTLQHIL